MGEAEVDYEVEAELQAHLDVDLSYAGRRSALSARRKDAGPQTTQTKSARLPVRNSSLCCILQVRHHPRTSQYTLQ